jgi:hypothetical protein
VGAALITASVAAVTRPLGAGPLRPGPVPVVLGAVCIAIAALMLHASADTQAAAVCRLIAPGNVVGAIAAIALLIAFPDAAHTRTWSPSQPAAPAARYSPRLSIRPSVQRRIEHGYIIATPARRTSRPPRMRPWPTPPVT